jgi:hypothetical protein
MNQQELSRFSSHIAQLVRKGTLFSLQEAYGGVKTMFFVFGSGCKCLEIQQQCGEHLVILSKRILEIMPQMKTVEKDIQELTPKEEYIGDQLSQLESRVNNTFHKWMKIDVGTGHPSQTSLCLF